jgi:hypothetical protein
MRSMDKEWGGIFQFAPGETTDDGIERLAVRPCKARSLPLPKTVDRCADDVGHFQGGPAHLFLSLPSLRL